MRRALVSVALLALAACSTPAPEPPPPPAPPPVAAAAPPPPVTPPPEPDACGAREMQHLVGRPRTEIPVPLKPNLQRVACDTCPVTMDYNQNRLNFFFDAKTGIIKTVKCG